MDRSTGLWAAAAILVVAMGLGWHPGRAGEPGTSFDAGMNGTKAFFELARRLLPDVGRHIDELVPPPEVDTLVLVGPARYPERHEWTRLHRWVSEGRSVVFAPRWEEPEADLGPFGVRIVENELVEGPVETSLVAGAIAWTSRARIELDAAVEGVEVLARAGGARQIVRLQVGDGILVVAATDSVFRNAELARGDNGLLAFRILEAAIPIGPVRFDESLNRSAIPRAAGVLLEEPLRPLTFELLLLAVLYGWRASRRFGPVRARTTAARRSLVEHARALGDLYARSGDAGPALRAYADYLRQHHRVRRLGADVEAVVRVAAARAGVDPKDLAAVLVPAAGRSGPAPAVPPAAAAAVVRSLRGLVRDRPAPNDTGGPHGARSRR